MAMQPELVYSIPGIYLQSFTHVETLTAGQLFTLQLNSAPQGMLIGLMVHIAPSSFGTSNDAPTNAALASSYEIPLGSSLRLSDLRLDYAGVSLYRCDTHQEMIARNRNAFNDNLKFLKPFGLDNRAAGITTVSGDGGKMIRKLEDMVYFIPLVDDAYEVIRRRKICNVPSYGGSQLTLMFTPAANAVQYITGLVAVDGSDGAYSGLPTAANGAGSDPIAGTVAVKTSKLSPFCPRDLAQSSAIKFNIVVTYVLSSLLELTAGAIDLQL
jgi:hypothetical protein